MHRVLHPHGTYQALRFTGSGATTWDLSSTRFTGCVIEELDLTGAQAQRVSFIDTEVSALDVSGAQPAGLFYRDRCAQPATIPAQ